MNKINKNLVAMFAKNFQNNLVYNFDSLKQAGVIEVCSGRYVLL